MVKGIGYFVDTTSHITLLSLAMGLKTNSMLRKYQGLIILQMYEPLK